MTKGELQEIAATYGLYTKQDVENRVSCELLSMGARNEELEKAYNEAEELLDKQIEATYKLFEENKELKEEITELKKQCSIFDKSLVTSTKNNIERQKIIDNIKTYAKTIIQDLLENTDEYARQRAEDFLKENK